MFWRNEKSADMAKMRLLNVARSDRMLANIDAIKNDIKDSIYKYAKCTCHSDKIFIVIDKNNIKIDIEISQM